MKILINLTYNRRVVEAQWATLNQTKNRLPTLDVDIATAIDMTVTQEAIDYAIGRAAKRAMHIAAQTLSGKSNPPIQGSSPP